MNQYARQYRNTQVGTASGKRLIVYLYEAAIAYLRDAGEDMRRQRVADAGRRIGYTIDILMELCGALDHAAFPALAERLHGLYNFMIEALAIAQIQRNAKAMRECESILTTLASAWRHALRVEKDEQPKSAMPKKRMFASGAEGPVDHTASNEKDRPTPISLAV